LFKGKKLIIFFFFAKTFFICLMHYMAIPVTSRAFVWRRLHSLLGLWLVLFLINHLLVNSQAALFFGDNARGFVHAVNSIHNLPYLPIVEFFLIGAPILFHAVWGIYILYQAKFNTVRFDGKTPHVIGNKRNYAFITQRITAWIVMVGIILHVMQFRFFHAPKTFQIGHQLFYFIKVSMDGGLYTVASRLNAQVCGKDTIAKEKIALEEEGSAFFAHNFLKNPSADSYDALSEESALGRQEYVQKKKKIEMLEKLSLSSKEVVVITKDVGTAWVLRVRDVFKNPGFSVLYTIFVLATCFHGINGFWTFCLTWGFFIKVSVQKRALRWVWGAMALIVTLGLAAIWGTYWLNLKA
jgi:succinate dehydrogenase / fumarate reductase, cytochrome b subunit